MWISITPRKTLASRWGARSIRRWASGAASGYGSVILPMDEALVLAAVDISGRPALGWDLPIPAQKVGDFDTELVKEFMLAFSRALGAAIHLRLLAGENSHHIIEGAFKALARALAQAVEIDERFRERIPSTKGTIL